MRKRTVQIILAMVSLLCANHLQAQGIPDLAVISFAALTNTIEYPSGAPQSPTIQVAYVVTNQGAATFNSYWRDCVCVSTNKDLSGTLSTQWFPHQGRLPKGDVYQATQTVNLPHRSGTYWMIFVAAGGGSILNETKLSNNVMAAPEPIIDEVLQPDLLPVCFAAVSNTINFFPAGLQSPTVPLAYTVTNSGLGSVMDTWVDRVYISTNSSMEGVVSRQDFPEGDRCRLPWPQMYSGDVYRRTNILTLPKCSGTYWLFLEVDAGNSIYDKSPTNNLIPAGSPVALTYEVVPPDLAPISLGPQSNSIGFYPPSAQNPMVAMIYSVTNQGAGEAYGAWIDTIYISTNSSMDGVIDSQSFNEGNAMFGQPVYVPVSGIYERTNLITLPQQSGSYWFFLQVNRDGWLYEGNLTNNVIATTDPLTINYEIVPPDLVPVAFELGTNSVTFFPPSPQSPSVWVTYEVKNAGNGIAYGYWVDCVYVSTNETMDGVVSSQGFGEGNWWEQYALVASGGNYQRTRSVTLPQSSGTYWLFLNVNEDGSLYECDSSNNAVPAAMPVNVTYQILPPDLGAVSIAAATNSVRFHPPGPQSPTVDVVYVVTNQGVGTALGSWGDTVYVSTNGDLSGAVSTQSFPHEDTLASGGSYEVTNTVNLPQQSGTYWLILRVNDGLSLYEDNLSNNVVTCGVPVSLTYQIVPPDLVATNVAALGGTNIEFYPPSPQYPFISVVYTITNQGSGDAWGWWDDRVYVSPTTNLSDAVWMQDLGVGSFEPFLVPAGGEYRRTNTFHIPTLQSASYWLFVSANSQRALYEENLANNVAMSAAPVGLTYKIVPPDLAPVSAALATNHVIFCPSESRSPTVQLSYTVTNQADGVASSRWWGNMIYVSTNNTTTGIISSQEIYRAENTPLPPGAAYDATASVALPRQPGTYWLLLRINFCPDIYEQNVTNNSMMVSEPVIVEQVNAPSIAREGTGVLTNGRFQLSITNSPGDVLEVQARTNLNAGTWESLGILTNSLRSGIFVDPATNQPQRYYRLRLRR